ncbi:hypothetical protein [Vallitalea okinawensis]|uniref:hypothetical protein n=1 Tax=Vallitalea okinawensis TaxID=2078660 RepID=UPI000CFCA5E1|nr:hypothetical protein [Vallitalea okinawensis]
MSISLTFHNQSNDEENSQVIVFKRVDTIAEPAKIKRICLNELIIFLPEIDLADIEKNDEISFNELRITSLVKGVKYKISTLKFDTEGVFPAEISIIATDCHEFRIEVITPEASLVTTVSDLVLEVFNPDGGMIMKVVDSHKQVCV